MSFSVPFEKSSFCSHLITGLRLELWLTPKPGLVDRRDNGSHLDLSFAVMESSIGLLARYLKRLQRALEAGASMALMVDIGQRAEQALLARFSTNTHKGAVFLSGLLLCARYRCADCSESELRPALAETAAEVLCRITHEDTHGQRARQRFQVGGILSETAKGLPTLFETALPAYREGADRGWTHEQAAWLAMARLMQTVEDTTTLHRCGTAGLERLRRDGRYLEHLLGDREKAVSWLTETNHQYRALHLTMGGVADLMAMTFALLAAKGALLPLHPASLQSHPEIPSPSPLTAARPDRSPSAPPQNLAFSPWADF